jgi:hypothetical protein
MANNNTVDPANVVRVTGYQNQGVMNDSATHAAVQFPAPWTSRIQTPIQRVSASSISAYANVQPATYGGPQHG